ncbi:MAG: long-chain-fatty-acid--CoA ligase [Hyphomicrobiales bacterium]
MGTTKAETAKADRATDYPWLAEYPSKVDWHAELTPKSLPDMFDVSMAQHAARNCTYFLGKSLSYGEIAEQTEKVAAGLEASGLKPGDKIGLLLPNCPYFIVFYFAALKIGCVVVNYNPLYTVEELDYQVKDSETRVMVTLDLKMLFEKAAALIESGTLERAVICPFAPLLPTVKSVLFRMLKRAELASPTTSGVAGSLIAFDDLLGHGSDYTAHKIEPETDVAVLQYTGGTTGVPKGAMLTHANLTINVQQASLWFPDVEEGGERILAILPFFHVFAMTCIMNYGLSRGFELILMPKFELEDAIKLIKLKRPTILPGVPTLFNAIMNHPSVTGQDLSSLVHCNSGGAPLPLEIKRGFESIAGCKVVEGYGLSETSPIATTNPPDGPVKENSIGLPLPGTVISIRSLEDRERELPVGEDGEVCISGPQVMKGYWQNPEATEDTFVGEFLRTGDVGHMDEDGFTFLIDRLKDLILCSGFNVYPRRIEDAIYEFPPVEEVTVIGVPDDYRGEAPKAFIKLKPNTSATVEEVLEFLKPKLSKIEMPEHIEFRDELPKTMVGKLSKKELREDA